MVNTLQYKDRLQKPEHILIVNQESRVRINQSELSLRMALEERGCKVTTLNFGHGEHQLVKHGKDLYLEAKGAEINISKVPLIMGDEKFMRLVHERMEHPKPGLKIEKRGDDIWVTYPPIREKVTNLTGSAIMMWDEGTDKAIDLMEELQKYGVKPSDSIQSLRDSRSKIITQAAFEKNGVPTPKTICVPEGKYDEQAITNSLHTLGDAPWYVKAELGDGGKAVRRIPDIAYDIENVVRKVFEESSPPWSLKIKNKSGESVQYSIPDIGYNVRDHIKESLASLGTPPWSIEIKDAMGKASTLDIPAIKYDVQSNTRTLLDIAKKWVAEGEGVVIQEAVPSPLGNRPQRTRVIVQDGEVIGALLWTGQEWAATDNAFTNKDNRTDIKMKSLPIDYMEQLTPIQKEVAIKATQAVGLSTAGIDLVGTSDKPLALEANRGPGLWFHKKVGQDTIERVADGIIANVRMQRAMDTQNAARSR